MKLRFALVAGALLAAGAAEAQGVFTAPTMPPPPSFTDTPKATNAKPRARRPAQTQEDASADAATTQAGSRRRAPSAATRQNSGGGTTGYADRIDSRPPRASGGQMELEDDPRAVRPVLNNGRAGMGMRF